MMKVLQGSRPPRPVDCADDLWNIVESCWDECVSKRPTARQVSESSIFLQRTISMEAMQKEKLPALGHNLVQSPSAIHEAIDIVSSSDSVSSSKTTATAKSNVPFESPESTSNTGTVNVILETAPNPRPREMKVADLLIGDDRKQKREESPPTESDAPIPNTDQLDTAQQRWAGSPPRTGSSLSCSNCISRKVSLWMRFPKYKPRPLTFYSDRPNANEMTRIPRKYANGAKDALLSVHSTRRYLANYLHTKLR
ncbi:hypothetical protein VKT23_020137 [Stygiomarasmius scandens]|uniref:Serine-threonine/tyrosine-protein kinase catalytic domain-containing protein n=1 Tax=Marasmiellus scandens TaxID=2682957 RepID=A0ABR1IJL6_9AGAR